MRLLSWNLQLFQAVGGSNNGLHSVLGHQSLVSRCVKVSQQQLPSLVVLVSGEDHVVGAVAFLRIIIMQHLFI